MPAPRPPAPPSADSLSPAEPGRRERKRLQQLDHLADVAWTLFQADGFEAVTMERIAEVADVAKGTLYKHFPVKEALLRHRFHRDLQAGWPAMAQRLQAHPAGVARLRCFLQINVAWCEAHRDCLLPYLKFRLNEPRHGGEGLERSGMDRLFTALIEEGQAAGEFRSDLPATTLATYLQFAHLSALLRWQSTPGLSLAAEMALMLDLFCHGMGSAR